jgi:polysaccharide deacetylase
VWRRGELGKQVFGVTEWPNGAKVAVAINVMYEQWSDGVAPGIGPMGNPLRDGIDYQAISWAAYGRETGIWNILEALNDLDVSASVYASGILSESAPESLAAITAGGHEICGHGWAQEMVPTAMTAAEELRTIQRCVQGLQDAAGQRPRGWISPRCTPSAATAQFLASEGFHWFGDVFDTELPYPITTGSGETGSGGNGSGGNGSGGNGSGGNGSGQIVALPFGMELNDLPLTIRYGRPISDLAADTEFSLAAREARETPSILDVTVHAHIGGRPDGIKVLRHIISRVVDSPSCWVATRAQIASAAQVFPVIAR